MRGAVPPHALTLYGIVLIRLGDYFGKNLIVLLVNVTFHKPGELRQKISFDVAKLTVDRLSI
jgi:hypothetical protein